jgi:hypothetical protein
MLVANKAIASVQRKRKKKFSTYDSDNDEGRAKNHKAKRMKKDSENSKITNYLSIKKNASRKQTKESKEEENEGLMNVDSQASNSSMRIFLNHKAFHQQFSLKLSFLFLKFWTCGALSNAQGVTVEELLGKV